jgi:hypothetical protein
MNPTFEILVPLEKTINTSIWTEVTLEDYSHEEKAFRVRHLFNQKYNISFNYFDKNIL